MRRVKVILVAAMAISMAGCVLSGKPKPMPAPPAAPQPVAPAPPPQPLSIPQTSVVLPTPQPVDPDALVTAQQPVTPPPPVQPKPTPPTVRRSAPPPKPADPGPQQPPEPTFTRPPIQEILPPEEQRRLLTKAQSERSEAHSLLAQAQRHPLTADEKKTVASITQWLKLSDEAENSHDMRSAEELAARALILAKELQSGK
jgi:hypothetical protein